MDKTRPATIEEIKTLTDKGEQFGPGDIVLCLEGKEGSTFGVIRHLIEICLDPGEEKATASLRRRAILLRDIETVMRAMGFREYYLTAPHDDPDYDAVIRNWGALPLGGKRYRKEL